VVKRAFDLGVASTSLLVLLPLFCVFGVLIKLDSNGPVFFRQERVGTRFRLFQIYKFRTMARDAPWTGSAITCGDDPRVTRVGRFLRRNKLDELPQLLNVLKGDMSIVGPRPELPEYVERFKDDYREILMVRPGMTDPASLKFRDEAALLGNSSDPIGLYVESILPEKLNLGKEYVRRSSLLSDVRLVIKTVAALSGFKVSV
jgi:lipopolysaccharide/colanic/teichoic acid biosynthesis glycosyltransferase